MESKISKIIEDIPRADPISKKNADAIVKIVFASVIILLIFLTILSILPWTALDSLTYFGWLYLFESSLLPRIYLVFAWLVTVALSPFLLPWCIYSEDEELKVRLRKDSDIKDGEAIISFNNGEYLKALKQRARRKWNLIVIFGDEYKLYKDGLEIKAQNPKKMEIEDLEMLISKLEKSEEQRQYSDYRNWWLNKNYAQKGVRIPDEFKFKKKPPMEKVAVEHGEIE